VQAGGPHGDSRSPVGGHLASAGGKGTSQLRRPSVRRWESWEEDPIRELRRIVQMDGMRVPLDMPSLHLLGLPDDEFVTPNLGGTDDLLV
jgi:hypothetical protein